VKQFLLGFGMATALWLAVLYAQSTGALNLFEEGAGDTPEGTATTGGEAAPAETTAAPVKRRRRGRSSRSRATGEPPRVAEYDTSEGMAGDDLGSLGARELAMGQAGGEDQLSEAEIDRGIDGVFKGIQRCLVLLPPGAPATGKVVFGMHISSRGEVTRVNLKGPSVMIRGETGDCFRRNVKAIRFRRFDGPDMIAHYPIIFE
jgi:hypothetical protein